MASTEVSATRLYLGNLPKNVTKADVEAHFATHGTGEITEIKLMNGFGFIEYKDPMDARDVVPAFRTFGPFLISVPPSSLANGGA
jgi:RNA recognition motif-containing protein